jgi:flagellar biosynthesis component FlhA
MMNSVQIVLGMPDGLRQTVDALNVSQGVSVYANQLLTSFFQKEIKLVVNVQESELISLQINTREFRMPQVVREKYCYESTDSFWIFQYCLALFQHRVLLFQQTQDVSDDLLPCCAEQCIAPYRVAGASLEEALGSVDVLQLQIEWSAMLHQVKHPADQFTREEYVKAWRENLFFEKGYLIPEPVFVMNPAFSDTQFQVWLNDLPYPVQHTLPLENYLALGQSIEEGQPIALPNTLHQPNFKGSHQICNYAKGLPINENHWGWIGFLQFQVTGVLQQQAACFMNQSAWRFRLDSFLYHDELKRLFTSRFSEDLVLAVLRLLMRSELPIRNLKKIMEAFLFSGDSYQADPKTIEFLPDLTVSAYRDQADEISFQDPKVLTDVVRRYLREEISIHYSKDNNLYVFTLDPNLENDILEAGEGDSLVRKNFLSNLDDALRSLDTGSNLQGILVGDASRIRLNEWVSEVYPWLAVFNYRELAPWISVHTLYRL